MPYNNPHHKTHQQRQRRRAGEVRRVEVVLSADSDRDFEIHDFLRALPPGTAGEFIRKAIHEKMQRGQYAPAPAPAQSEAVAQLETLIQEVAAQRREIAQLREVVTAPVMVAADPAPMTDRRRRVETEARSAHTPPSAATMPSAELGEVSSSGIDMSRPRRRSPVTSAPTPAVETPTPELDERAQLALTRELVRSIQGFGKDR